MNLNSALRELKRRGTAQNRKVYRRHGVDENMYGVSFGDLRGLAKQIKTDQSLAIQLWATGNHEARVLATLIADPDQFDAKMLDAWAKDLSNYTITDEFVGLVARTAYRQKKAEKWRKAQVNGSAARAGILSRSWRCMTRRCPIVILKSACTKLRPASTRAKTGCAKR